MVEQSLVLDSIFLSLADATRRDMLELLRTYSSMTISDIAIHYRLTFAAVSKHLKVLEQARLVSKRKKGRHQIVTLSAPAFEEANQYLKKYESLWNDRLDRLELLLNQTGGSHE